YVLQPDPAVALGLTFYLRTKRPGAGLKHGLCRNVDDRCGRRFIGVNRKRRGWRDVAALKAGHGFSLCFAKRLGRPPAASVLRAGHHEPLRANRVTTVAAHLARLGLTSTSHSSTTCQDTTMVLHLPQLTSQLTSHSSTSG